MNMPTCGGESHKRILESQDFFDSSPLDYELFFEAFFIGGIP